MHVCRLGTSRDDLDVINVNMNVIREQAREVICMQQKGRDNSYIVYGNWKKKLF